MYLNIAYAYFNIKHLQIQGLPLVSANVNAGMLARRPGNPATGQMDRSFLGVSLVLHQQLGWYPNSASYGTLLIYFATDMQNPGITEHPERCQCPQGRLQ